jgi:hypothetical protein
MRSFARIAATLALVLIVGLVACAARAADITGPEKIDAYRLIDHSTVNPALWEVEPSTGVDLRQSQDGKSVVWVAPPGKYKVVATIVLIDFDKRSWSIQKAVKEVAISSPNPPLPPDPDPQPEPGAKYQVAMLVESGALDNLPRAQQAILASLKLRDELARRGHHLVGVLEVDQSKDAPAAFAPWYEAVKGQSPPRLAIAPVAGGAITVHPLPADESALWKLLGETL